MNKSRLTVFKILTLVLCLTSVGLAYGQKETKTFNERFKVNKDAVLSIDTSHADIEFETWGRDEVGVEAVIEIEGATSEETQRYFASESFEILGNSQKVSITTREGGNWLHEDSALNLNDFHFEMLKMPHTDGFDMAFEIMELPEMAELPELPRAPVPQFDYEAYKEDKEGYMKEWQKEFEKSFGAEYQEKIEAWGERMEKRQDELIKTNGSTR